MGDGWVIDGGGVVGRGWWAVRAWCLSPSHFFCFFCF
jgi:hypothetical protein